MIDFKINKEEQFQINAHSFAVGFTESGYTLSYSTSGEDDFTDYSQNTPANETLFVIGVPKGAYFKLKGNITDGVDIRY